MDPTTHDQSPDRVETRISTDIDEPRPQEAEAGGQFSLSRWGTLTGLAGLAGLVLLVGEASAQEDDEESREWKTDIDADGHRLLNLGALTTAAKIHEEK